MERRTKQQEDAYKKGMYYAFGRQDESRFKVNLLDAFAFATWYSYGIPTSADFQANSCGGIRTAFNTFTKLPEQEQEKLGNQMERLPYIGE